jgi:hypothetical protein
MRTVAGLKEDRQMGDRSTRRAMLTGVAVGLLAGLTPALRAQSPRKKGPSTVDDEKTAAVVRARAKKAGLGQFANRSSDHFLGIGDGPGPYSTKALELSEEIAEDYLDQFRRRGFKVDYPSRRLAVVTLKDGASYRAFSDDHPDEADGGRYYPEDNWLVIFDFRADQSKDVAEAKRYNTFTLVHETIHLLCFNTGLLDRQAEVPGAIGEGLATYGEMWTPRSHGALGGVNHPRLRALARETARGTPWIPISRLLADDKAFADPGTSQLAYAEAWLLVHYLMETEERLPRFRAYLAGLPRLDAADGPDRVKYAESRLGSLHDLDAAVRRHAQRMARKAKVPLSTDLSRARG